MAFHIMTYGKTKCLIATDNDKTIFIQGNATLARARITTVRRGMAAKKFNAKQADRPDSV